MGRVNIGRHRGSQSWPASVPHEIAVAVYDLFVLHDVLALEGVERVEEGLSPRTSLSDHPAHPASRQRHTLWQGAEVRRVKPALRVRLRLQASAQLQSCGLVRLLRADQNKAAQSASRTTRQMKTTSTMSASADGTQDWHTLSVNLLGVAAPLGRGVGSRN